MTYFFAWGTTAIILLCAGIFLLRVVIKRNKLSRDHFLCKLNRRLRRCHKFLGVLAIVFAFMHCSISERAAGLSSDLGEAMLILVILLALSYCLRKLLKHHWIKIHRILTALLMACFVVHAIWGICI